jgi:hypothetical protein
MLHIIVGSNIRRTQHAMIPTLMYFLVHFVLQILWQGLLLLGTENRILNADYHAFCVPDMWAHPNVDPLIHDPKLRAGKVAQVRW